MSDRERAALAQELSRAAPGLKAAHSCDCGDTGPAAGGTSSPRLAPFLDCALPQASATRAEAERFLAAARDVEFRSVYVQPVWAALAVRMLHGRKARVGTFLGFPQAGALTPAKCMEAEMLLRNGVQEIAMIADIGALRAGDLETAFVDIQAVAKVAACRSARLNVFLELPRLDSRGKLRACVVAKLAGASGILAATGFDGCNASVSDIKLMVQAVGGELDVVAAGGVHTAPAAERMLAAGASRVCTSHGLEITGRA